MVINSTLKTYFSLSLLLSTGLASAQIMDKTSLVAGGAKVEKLGDGFSFTEGPVADKKGNVFFTDQPNNKIMRWDAKTGKITLFTDVSGRSNGMYFDKRGNLITCADEENQIWSFDKKGNHKVFVKNFGNKLLNGPNDLWLDAEGGIYFTDPLYPRPYWSRDPAMQQDGQHVYYLFADHKTLVRVENQLKKPNGIIGTQDGKHLYVADIEEGKTYVYDIEKPGTLANKRLFTEMGSDGMTLDSKGNLYLSGNGITVFNPLGEQIAHIPVHDGWTANVCFGGKQRNILFMTAQKEVFGLKMNVKGN